MQTSFTPAQLADPDIRDSESILRSCVHCGFCTATCPTYVLLGDELDSPRGRIYLMKQMLESGAPPTPAVVKHIDRCLSCLACMTTCPSGVHYQHLVDHGRAYIEEHYRRPLPERLLRWALATVLPRPMLTRLALIAAAPARYLAPILPYRLRPLLALQPRRVESPTAMERPQSFAAEGQRRMRVAVLTGCVQQVIAPAINAATIRLLNRHGCEVIVAPGSGCCGALSHHLGKDDAGRRWARENVAAWTRELEGEGLDAIVINASGCGTQVKDYGFMLREEGDWADKAARISALAKDVTELLTELGLEPAGERVRRPVVAYHSACSLQHGQRLHREPAALLAAAGFEVRSIPEAHLCCGSAGTYNLLQPELATRLRDRKLTNIARVTPDVIAAGNIGCITQIASGTNVPVVHTVELLDWATGGPKPAALADWRDEEERPGPLQPASL